VVNGGAWWRITSLYYNAKGQYLSSRLSLKGEYSVKGSSNITLNDPQNIVLAAISSKKLPNDPNGAYLILTGANVAVTDPSTVRAVLS
jgi:hypothetical protein